MLAVLSDGIADFGTEKDLGLAVWTNRAAGFYRRSIDHVLHREVLTVAQTHAVRHRMVSAAAAIGHAFLSKRRRRHAAYRRRRRRISIGLLRLRRLLPKAAEQKIKETLCERTVD
ncbi:MAG: hypothetical protein WAK55_22655 [Xanthobacteraceae bacterium]